MSKYLISQILDYFDRFFKKLESLKALLKFKAFLTDEPLGVAFEIGHFAR